jgi:hypothetical protein
MNCSGSLKGDPLLAVLAGAAHHLHSKTMTGAVQPGIHICVQFSLGGVSILVYELRWPDKKFSPYRTRLYSTESI